MACERGEVQSGSTFGEEVEYGGVHAYVSKPKDSTGRPCRVSSSLMICVSYAIAG